MISASLKLGIDQGPRRFIGRTRHLAPYWLAVLRRAPLDVQLQLLPRRTTTRVRWIDLKAIPLATDVRDWREPSDGFALRDDWDVIETTPRPSIFESASDAATKAMTHHTIRALFLDGRPYRDTPQYHHMVQAVKQRRPEIAYGCTSRLEVDEYFENLREAFESMRRNGYLTQRQLGGDPFDEVKLYVTRYGEWCHGNGGNHRIRIAEVLGIRWIPFVVAGAHWDFLVGLSRGSGRPPRAAFLGWLKTREGLGEVRFSSPKKQ